MDYRSAYKQGRLKAAGDIADAKFGLAAAQRVAARMRRREDGSTPYADGYCHKVAMVAAERTIAAAAGLVNLPDADRAE